MSMCQWRTALGVTTSSSLGSAGKTPEARVGRSERRPARGLAKARVLHDGQWPLMKFGLGHLPGMRIAALRSALARPLRAGLLGF